MFMTRKKAYRSIAELSAEVAARMEQVEAGNCSLSEMDEILAEIRELEERIIVIRYKAMERLRYPTPRASRSRVAEAYQAPELPLETIPDEPKMVQTTIVPEEELKEITLPEPPAPKVEEPMVAEEEEEVYDPNQVSLIDSIAEIKQEGSINDKLQEGKKKSVAQALRSKPIKSIRKALNLNQKMGLINQVFGGDEVRFKEVVEGLDQAADLDSAVALWAGTVSEEQREELAIVRKMDSLIQRRFA